MKRGSICWVDMGPAVPPEFGKTRPAVVVSNTVQNEVLDSVVVIPLSTTPGEIWPLRIACDTIRGKESFAVLPGIRQVSRRRLAEIIAPASLDFMARLDRALGIYLGE